MPALPMWQAEAGTKPAGAAVAPALDPFPENSEPKAELAVGGLRASVTIADAGNVQPVGGSAVVSVVIVAPGGNRAVTLLAEGEGGDVVGITGTGAKTSPVRGGLAAEVPLPASGTVTLIVEMSLKSRSAEASGKPRNRMRLTLLPQKGGRDETVLAWSLADCSGDYHKQLQTILVDRRQRMTTILDAASASLPEMPAKWLFPAAPVAAPNCKVGKGKPAPGCAPAKSVSEKSVSAEWTESRVLKLASAVATQKGALPGFQQRRQPLRQVSYTMLSGLRLYMDQDPHPALCSGVEDMVDYYVNRTPLLKNTIADTGAALAAAQAAAKSKVATLAAAPAATGLADQLDQVGKAILAPAGSSELAAIQGVLPKLQQLKAALDGSATADLAAERRAAATDALRMIEAAYYLSVAAEKYAGLDDAIYGTMNAIKDAHRTSCVCSL